MKKIFLTAITTLLTSIIFVQSAMPAFAQKFGEGRVMHEVSRFQNQASHTAQTQQNELQRIIKRSDELITNRLNSLNKLLSRIQNDKRLSASEKSSLTSDIQTAISGLSVLKTKIDADTDAPTARADEKQIITNYYVYAVFEPKMRLLITINNLQTTTSHVQALVPQLQKLIDTYKSQGKDVSKLQILLDDVSSQLQTISTTLTSDATAVQNISLADKDTAKTTYTKVRQDLAQIVRSGFAKIRSDFAQMRPTFKQIIGITHSTSASSPTEIEVTATESPASPSASQ